MTNSDATVAQDWVHSHEEDRPGEQVFRPASYAFPPSRGRSGLNLKSDGSYSERSPGPTDQPEEHPAGAWVIDGDELKFEAPDGAIQVRKIISLEPDKLVLAI